MQSNLQQMHHVHLLELKPLKASNPSMMLIWMKKMMMYPNPVIARQQNHFQMARNLMARPWEILTQAAESIRQPTGNY